MSLSPAHLLPIGESGDPLVPARAVTGLVLGPDPVLLRSGVRWRIEKVAAALASQERTLLLTGGWRSVSDEKANHEELTDQLRANKKLSSDDKNRILTRFSDWYDDEEAPPSHSTGGAVDVTLGDVNGHPLDLGGPVHAWSPTAAYAKLPARGRNDIKARRELLRTAMSTEGFQPSEHAFWHFSHGDQVWTLAQKGPVALYGSVVPVADRWVQEAAVALAQGRQREQARKEAVAVAAAAKKPRSKKAKTAPASRKQTSGA